MTHRSVAVGGVCLGLLMFVSGCSDSTGNGPVGTKYLVTLSTSTAFAGDVIVVAAQLADNEDKPVHQAGITVLLTTSGSGVIGMPNSTTDRNGLVTTTYTCETVERDGVVITAVDQHQVTGSSPALKIGPLQPAQYAVTVSNPSPVAGSTIAVSAQQTDRYGNPTKVAGAVVTWDFGPAYYTGIRGTFSSPTSTTNAQGVATVDFTSISANGSFRIAAIDDHGLAGYGPPITIGPAPATKFLVTAPVTDPPAGATVVVYATAADAYGNIVQVYSSLIWSVSGGGTLSASQPTPGSNYSASVRLTTGPVPGVSYVVTAYAQGVSGSSPTITTQQQMSLAQLSSRFSSQSSCGLAGDGGVWCWGAAPLTNRPLPGKVLSQPMSVLTNGDAHACGIAGGRVLCWGYNGSGQLGDNTTSNRSSPTPINSSLSFTSVSAGESHTCALATTRDIYCWGLPNDGRLGDGVSSIGLNPVKVAGGLTFTAVSAGTAHTCAIATSGDAYCWGFNADGELGNGKTVSTAFPVPVSGGLKFSAISAGNVHTCGVSAGSVFCWGSNLFGQLGVNHTTAGSSLVPTQVPAPVTFVSVSAGAGHTCALTVGGSAYCWGDNSDGELGDAEFTGSIGDAPRLVPGYSFISITTGGSFYPGSTYYKYDFPFAHGHTCGLTTSRVAYCWGSDLQGELGAFPQVGSSRAPLKVSGQP